MKKVILIVAFVFSIANSYSQKTSSVYLPAKSADMPSWMNLFYNGVSNAIQLEEAYDAYYQTHPFEKNTYTQYYKRWMMENERYIQDDGTVFKPQINQSSNNHSHAKNSNSQWSLIGPVETFQPSWFDTAQPSIPWQVNIYAFDVAPSDHNIISVSYTHLTLP